MIDLSENELARAWLQSVMAEPTSALPYGAKIVAWCLADLADEFGETVVTVDEIGDRIGSPVDRSVRRNLAELRDGGWLVVEDRRHLREGSRYALARNGVPIDSRMNVPLEMRDAWEESMKRFGAPRGIHRDWLDDPDVASCSNAARLVSMGLMLRCRARDLVFVGGIERLASLVVFEAEKTRAAVAELEAAGQVRTTDEGIVLTGLRRFVRTHVQTPRKLRLQVFERDGYVCTYCGADVRGKGKAHADHVVPNSRGGTTDLDNLVTACAPCNLRKHARTPEQWRAAR
jgi:hypothetical protein